MIIVFVMVCAGLVLCLYHPSALSFLPPCPTKTVLGIECPGCGSTRAVHHVLNLRFIEAWQLNPALLCLGLPVLGLWLADLVGILLARKRILFTPGRRFGITLAALLLIYMLARNLA